MSDNTELLKKRRNRVIAIILGLKEREIDQYLPPEVAMKLRKVILDQVNDLYETMLDLSGADDAEYVYNELYLQKLEEVRVEMTSLRGLLEVR